MSNIHNDPLLAELQQWVTATLYFNHSTRINPAVLPVVNRHAQAPANRSGTTAGDIGAALPPEAHQRVRPVDKEQ